MDCFGIDFCWADPEGAASDLGGNAAGADVCRFLPGFVKHAFVDEGGFFSAEEHQGGTCEEHGGEGGGAEGKDGTICWVPGATGQPALM